jgi:hypothetical protein
LQLWFLDQLHQSWLSPKVVTSDSGIMYRN